MIRLLIVATFASSAVAAKLDVIYEWKYIDYVWKNYNQKSTAIAEGKYDHTQIFTIDVQKVPDGRVFVTTPRFNPRGVPATLSTISSRRGPGGPLLSPYPDWSWHNQSRCDGITSVWRVALDECNRLWVLDSGKVGDDQVCPAQLLMFDVYMADVDGGGLVIWDGLWTWRLNKDVFNADPASSDFSIAGVPFNLPDGIFGLALTPQSPSMYRHLFFRPLASLKQYSFSVYDLERSKSRPNDVKYTTYDYDFPSQVTAEAFSRDGILFFGLSREIAIGCWNINNKMDDEHVVIIAQDNDTLQFVSSIKITKHPYNSAREQLWISTNRFQKIYNNIQDFGEINFRILSGAVDTLVSGSKCQRRRT